MKVVLCTIGQSNILSFRESMGILENWIYMRPEIFIFVVLSWDQLLKILSSLYLPPYLVSFILFIWFLMKIFHCGFFTIDHVVSLICTKESVQCDCFHNQSFSFHLSCLLKCLCVKLFCKNEYMCICHSWINFLAKLNILNYNKLNGKALFWAVI